MKTPKIKCVLLVFIFKLLSADAKDVAVIGAGPSGLASASNAIKEEYNVTVFEKSSELGGVWFYTDRTEKDEFGVDVHSPMYRNLKTNLQLTQMEFPSFYYPLETPDFPSHEVVLKYLNDYADKFNVRSRIRFNHVVEIVSWKNNVNKWSITVRYSPCNRTTTYEFDAVFICIGFASSPYIPKIKGYKNFKGDKLHSKHFRAPETFLGKDVLVIGSGASGTDIVKQLREIGINVVQSIRSLTPITVSTNLLGKLRQSGWFTKNEKSGQIIENGTVIAAGKVKHFTRNGVKFYGGLQQKFDAVIFATGYERRYPFLDESTKIRVKNGMVEPLFELILNIEHTSMAFIGIPEWPGHFQTCDLQARFALEFISERKSLPEKDEMMKNSKNCITSKEEYYDILAKTAGIEINSSNITLMHFLRLS